jgi:AraC family transcriptional activator of tynA and feaB
MYGPLASALGAPARFEAWRHALSSSHMEWDLEPAPEGPFGARIRRKTLDGISIIDCHCDPCSGIRRRSEIGRSDGAYFGVLFALRGRELVRLGHNEAVLTAGDFVMWDSEREMEFRVLEPLHKLTLLVPKPRLKMFLGDAEKYAGKVVSGSDKAEGIAAEALRRVARDFATVSESSANVVLDPILSLLSATLEARNPPSKASLGHNDSFRTFCRHVEMNLGDSALTPAAVASAHGVSVRYLHLVFAEQGTSFGRLLRQKRLAHCCRELSIARRADTITEIAFRWGFNDMAHFSRAFRAEFGMSPGAARKAAVGF